MDGKNKISILCPSYNHQQYIHQTIESIFNQTYQNYEVIIVDDCSSDSTVEIASKFSDKRMRIIRNSYNYGLSRTLNKALSIASGEVVCILATDDMLYPTHLEKAMDLFLERINIGAVYGRLSIVNENSDLITTCGITPDNRFELLRSMFYDGNKYLPAPGSCFRKEIFNKIGNFNPALIQTQDYDMNIRLLLEWEIATIQDSTVMYRRPSYCGNLSSSDGWVKICYENERHTVLDNYLKINSVELLKNIFPSITEIIKEDEPRDIGFALACSAIREGDLTVSSWGFQRLINYLSTEDEFAYCSYHHAFEGKTFINLYKDRAKNVMENTVHVAPRFLSRVMSEIRRTYNRFLR